MSFAKLVSLLQRKQLWFSSAELLGDEWEVTPDPKQIAQLMTKREPSETAESVHKRVADTVKAMRKRTFVSCWSASDHESHALWRIYCASSEGVAVQTTLERLQASIGLPVLEVSYGSGALSPGPVTARQLVTQKRAMFAYENEVRIVLQHDFGSDRPGASTIGAHIDWDPEQHVERIYVHPEAQYWFMETVTDAVQRLAPKLSSEGRIAVAWSAMSLKPPF